MLDLKAILQNQSFVFDKTIVKSKNKTWSSVSNSTKPLGKGPIKQITKVWTYMSKLGLPYLPRTLVWTKINLVKYSYCQPYLHIQKVWTISDKSLFLNVYFLTFVRILLGNN